MGWFSKKTKSEKIAVNTPRIPKSTPKIQSPLNYGNYTDLFSDVGMGVLDSFTGNKFLGGFGKTKIYVDGTIDYYTLRVRSKQLYIDNLYAAGLINRLVFNSINTGLKLQIDPKNQILGVDPDELQEWTEETETVFQLWGDDPLLVDWKKEEDFDLLQWTVYLTAKLSGDCLIVLRVVKPHNLPVIQVIDGRHVVTPIKTGGKNIKNGIEFDSKDRIVAYWVDNKRIPAFGEKSGRRIAWMVYGTKKLIDHSRGIPLISCALQALREVDRYTDSELRASFLNSVMTAWIKRDPNSIGSIQPFGRAAMQNESLDVQNSEGDSKTSNFAFYNPGVMLDKLAPGEEPVSFDTKRPNLNFTEFTRAMLAAVAWGIGLPPEIYFLEFKNNFSASRQASNEFNSFLKMDRDFFAKQFCQPYYKEWLSAYAIAGKTVMPGYVESLRDPTQWETRSAWQSSRWIGVSRPSVDPFKEIQAYGAAVDYNFMSTSDAILELRGDDFDKVLARKKSEQDKINANLEPSIEEDNDAIQHEEIPDIRQLISEGKK
jgi:lambda family phage portal protein